MPNANELLREYERVRAYTAELCAPLATEDYIPQPIVDVSPPKWNIAHTTWFFETMILKEFVADYSEFDPNYAFLFNSYYNTLGDRTRRDNRGDLSRPTVEEVYKYRAHVDAAMAELLSADVSRAVAELVVLGLNHEQQHQELFLADFKYILGQNPIFPVYLDDYAIEETPDARIGGAAEIKEGVYEIGYQGDGFCFDNELARHKVYLNDFTIAHDLVTNLDYLEFVDSGGYRNFNLWHAEGWDWVNQNEIEAPLYWQKRGGEWFTFTLGGLRPLAFDAPVCHVSFYEAAAFAEWKGARLPTEFEWEAASGHFDFGLRWEWTNSAYLPYPGFSKAPGAVGEYNGKFMVNQMVLRGASVATPAEHSRPSYRNFFHPHLSWQFTGIRLAS